MASRSIAGPWRAAPAATALVAGSLLLAAPAAATEPAVTVTPAEASEALNQAEAALAGEPGTEPTVALNQLAAAVPALEGRERERAGALLARPIDGDADQYGDGYPPGAPIASAASEHFCVTWVNAEGFADAPVLTDANGTADGDGTPDYVETILEIAEQSYAVEVAPGSLGWEPPKPDLVTCAADAGVRADIYLKQLGELGLFGYESTDLGQGQARSQYGYIVIDDDYAASEFGYPDPLLPAQVTVAHEFNHLLQQNYDSFQDPWVFESVATWSEDFVYPQANDYVAYVKSFAASPDEPLTNFRAGRGLKVYGSAVWNHWLSGRFGVALVRGVWEVSDLTDPPDFGIGAYQRAILDLQGKGFSREFARFAIASSEWRSGFGGFPDGALYRDIERRGTLVEDRRKDFTLDHTAYRLLRVPARGQGKLRLTVDAEPGVRSGIALVARDGGKLTGTVIKASKFLARGKRRSLTLRSPGAYERITAVIVNADGRIEAPGKHDHRNAWVYLKDDVEFRVRLER